MAPDYESPRLQDARGCASKGTLAKRATSHIPSPLEAGIGTQVNRGYSLKMGTRPFLGCEDKFAVSMRRSDEGIVMVPSAVLPRGTLSGNKGRGYGTLPSTTSCASLESAMPASPTSMRPTTLHHLILPVPDLQGRVQAAPIASLVSPRC